MIRKIKNIISYLYPIRVEQCIGNVSPYLEINLVNGKYMLDTANVNYSYGALHKVFDQTFKDFNLKERSVKNALILGFGAGSIASLLSDKYSVGCEITGIEKDQVVIHLAHKYFNINRVKNLKLICDDAYNYVQTHSKKFDVIVVDIYIDEQLPKCFHEKRFLKQLDRLLQHHGVLFFNKVVNDSQQEIEFNELASTVEEIFGHSLTYKLKREGTENYILIHDRRNTITSNSFVIKPNKNLFYNKPLAPSFNYEHTN